MKDIKQILIEKLHINKDVKVIGFTDEDLRKDYNEVWGALTKSEKKVIADKYGVTDIRIKPIQIAILDKLRENRFEKSEFTEDDIYDFFKYEITGSVYNKLKVYLDQEPKEFIEYLLEYYNKICNKYINVPPSMLSIAHKYNIKCLKNITRYLDETYR